MDLRGVWGTGTAWLHQPFSRRQLTIARLRLASGLVLFAFALIHFVNNALGIVDVTWMEAFDVVRRAFWRSLPGTVLLYGSLVIHISLGLWKLVRRTTWRMPFSEALQLILGLAIPFWLLQHILATRGMSLLYGLDDRYTNVLRNIWPALAVQQPLLLLIVWLHGCIGLHFWLSTKAFYTRAAPWLLALAVLVPALGILGFTESARRLEVVAPGSALTPQQAQDLEKLTSQGVSVLLAIGAAVLFILVARLVVARIRPGFSINYTGLKSVRAHPGPTLLEISRANGIPHAAACGGRGRCSTCRVLITEGFDSLPPPQVGEAAALERINAPTGVRLACQIRPTHSLTLRRLVAIAEPEPAGSRADPYRWGIERRVTVMFTDLRDFTALTERIYPYDSVFLLNRYFELMSEAIRSHDGIVDKFLGDGIMALFGIAPAQGAGSRNALLAARAMQAALEEINREFATTLRQPLRMGIGIHTGPAVLGRVGAATELSTNGRNNGALTALGDTVNTASRLEAMTKEFKAFAVVSESALAGSGLTLDGCARHEITVRGRRKTEHIYAVTDFAVMAEKSSDKQPAALTPQG
ncbi:MULTISPECIES: adenylate/guanylate cyclase domain-containing protein [unclassified Chelatococcus]|uniref:adenylate/guanylate cyclase domain-containing protein n=1 Tax=unclassified Chelatococcus TaxID=2638111 RepID=UPI001BCABD42|nr:MULTISPECIES: adenylate/guanylate cyclase domain-containing protein [unclassified Chelatococcus]MBS7698253.1 adenylate/guanylate cyclase domain-containing protein [Chelatococcus sp. YT9]MBX3560036.1 adenylate/guanylate cyclase domain-containing protein [Chelatococcus sp.]